MAEPPTSPPRYVPHRPFPPYTYVPRKAPHPTSDASGHSYNAPHSAPPPLDETNWPQHEAYLYGIDLFNHGYYWEAHESWEAAWHAVGRRGPSADLLKGLIHLAAAGVKLREGRAAGVVSHLEQARKLSAEAADGGSARRWGLGLAELVDNVRAALAAPPPTCDLPPTDVRPLFGFRLRPTGEPDV